MKKRLIQSLVVGGSLAMLLFVGGARTAAENPHEISRQTPQSGCGECHNTAADIKDDGILTTKNHTVDLAAFAKDGVAMCSSCHNPNQGHKVGLNIDFPVPADLPLNEEHDMTCLTCHYTHGRLDSDRPQASHSFIDKLMNAERLKKSFLLRRNNSDGELCLTCHNVN
ncbi:hypothetical protein ACQE3D_07525 [Methylomonas sp. MS20]|uniref:hypothetical protein n=1 Tax=Methylomonas sp. MS20 TaxID=3418769 RepID=UPI003CFE9826